MHRLEDYDYDLPRELIAQAPVGQRDQSRLLVLDRHDGSLRHLTFPDVSRYFGPYDVLVINDTQVVRARLSGTKDSGGRVELLILDPYKDSQLAQQEGYTCLIKASKKPRPGSLIHLMDGVEALVLSPVINGQARIRIIGNASMGEIFEQIGEIPLPPYIERRDAKPATNDSISYQTVYARIPGAVAAPTAGLHFSLELLRQLATQGVNIVKITLHVGYGTFSPIRTQDIRYHTMHPEYAEVSVETADRLERARRNGDRIVAVGTTVVRTLEWVAQERGCIEPYSGLCHHYIYPGYEFRVVQAMLTNFHLPKSSLLLLVMAFAGRDRIVAAYQEAIRNGYRFFSYGDAMLIL
ncbi:MAG TPA: tRNA preQ1(34) S-adenosylmethionine ribosyltransferase-isomerase QueA [Syntrophobacteraceae bacterium]|nr:tRNA preQ1(34) S-adenosylmethionine ribosyltransferase-isomerase QueA [Syntrophobacteraceae bacterium]